MSILKLKPAFKDNLWGGHRLVEEFNFDYDGEICAEAWVLSCHPDGPSVIAEGEYAGKTLKEYIDSEGFEVLGTNCRRFREFPILVKFIDARDDLSIQVHPSNGYALRNEGQYGKTEMWYVLDAEPGASAHHVTGVDHVVRVQDGLQLAHLGDGGGVVDVVEVPGEEHSESGLCGSVPTTTYGENIGVMAVTRVYSVWVIGGAACFSILLAWFGKASALIQSIPAPVMGGVSFLLYGMIAASGLRLLVDSKINYAKARNLAMSSVIFVTGLSGAAINIGEVQLTGMCLATIVGMIMGLAFFIIDKTGIANDKDEPDTIE